MVAHIGGTVWLRQLRAPAQPRAVLVCFPPGGGSVGAFRALAREFDSGTAVFAVQYPGRQDRLGEPALPDLAATAEAITADLRTWPPAPLALFGHSMGATLAFETARRLEAQGRTVTHLFASGRIAPDAPYTGDLHRGSDSDLIDELARLADDPASVEILRTEPGLAELVLPAVRDDYRAVETYVHRPGEPLRCTVSVLLGDDDPTVTAEQAQRWRGHTTGEFELTTFPGRHFYLDDRPAELARFLTARLG
ncbi:thioesterase II family protein [Nocardia sp. alder85J]|uniref:thioesterase II family protein n=1 Tax=Nocardia sp. alder85J TaxID=2862949 RepID=UPI001CD3B325|nr:alpha/beta fold hydrolase [Nocardia sp. alder85J]MCX4091540.1 alpha/beta fold hydrolase [Nocardia sp. alder85J]